LRAHCLCALALSPARAHETELVILQHPLEQFEVKGTARLLALSLARCSLRVGERFEPLPNPEGRIEALLYPGGASPLAADTPAQRLRLYVLDGSWRKSRLLLHSNPWLQALPRLALQAGPGSDYGAVRKAQAAHQLSTLEACAQALAQLEGLSTAPLRAVQAGLISALKQRPSARLPAGPAGTPAL
jgi:DTW domain-containing protein YfiP